MINHYRPRSRQGWIAVGSFLGLFALTQPPMSVWAGRVELRVLDLPFLYVYLLAIYVALIAVLIWTARRGL